MNLFETADPNQIPLDFSHIGLLTFTEMVAFKLDMEQPRTEAERVEAFMRWMEKFGFPVEHDEEITGDMYLTVTPNGFNDMPRKRVLTRKEYIEYYYANVEGVP